MDRGALAGVLSLLRCPRCADALSDELACPTCGDRGRLDHGTVDLGAWADAPASLGARTMSSRWLARIYDRWWRPVMFGLATGFRMPSLDEETALVLARLRGTRGPWLDLSCGPGNFTERLVERAPGGAVVAVDRSRAMLEQVRRNAPSAARVRADAHALPFASGTFGAVVNLAALDLYEDPAHVVGESARVLSAGGRWLASSLRTPTEIELASYAARASLVRFDRVRFGRYVVAWADKP